MRLMEYLQRVTDQELSRHLAALGAVLIEGPKACGKTATATRHASTVFTMDDDDAAVTLLNHAPDQLFSHPTPILFDEWQAQPSLWNKVRRQVDQRASKGQFILTGSATPQDDVSRHSGAGRFARLHMRPMSLFESGHSTGEMSLQALCTGQSQKGDGRGLDFTTLTQRIVAGGWPELIHAEEDQARNWLDSYITTALEIDVPRLGIRRQPQNLRRLLSSLARNTGTAVRSIDLARDVGGDHGPIASATLAAYLDALSRLNLIEDSPAWLPHMRSRTRLRQAPVRYLVDPSLGLAALEVGSAELTADRQALGLQFEALAIRDLRIYAQAMQRRGKVYSWRDSNGREVDAIVDAGFNAWAAFEIKLNTQQVDQAASSLLNFAASVDTAQHGKPACLAVITSDGYGYQRPDGVHVIPIGALGP